MDDHARDDIGDLLTHWIPRDPLPQFIDDTVFLEIKDLLAQHPDDAIQKWSRNPRTYTLLRMLGHVEDGSVFLVFVREQIGDVWLPLSTRYLSGPPLATSGLSINEFRRLQPYVLSKPELMNESNFLSGVHTHRYIIQGKAHFEELEELGHGGSAQVGRVRHKLTGKYFACKRIARGRTFKEQRHQLVEFEQELIVLQRVHHRHLVSYVGSYTDFDSFSLILNPVADQVLKAVLLRQDKDHLLPPEEVLCLRAAFGCLATAISYLHDQRVRHKDIKPGNVLISGGGRIYLCDFGISRDWSIDEHSTTEGTVFRYTRRYCAPEVIGQGSRNESSDIWSLGTVFLEMITVIKGYALDDMNEFLSRVSEGTSTQGFWSAPKEIKLWLDDIRSSSPDDAPLDWVTMMIREDPEKRPTAEQILNMIHQHSHGRTPSESFIGPCCTRFDSVVSNDMLDSPTLSTEPVAGLGISSIAPRTAFGFSDVARKPTSISPGSKSSRERSISPKAPRHSRGGSGKNSVTITQAPNRLSVDATMTSSAQGSTISRQSSRASQLQSMSPPMDSVVSFPLSPIPPPASFEVECLCARQPEEQHIFNAVITSFLKDDGNDAATDICTRCEVPELRVQIYETPARDLKSNRHNGSKEQAQMPQIEWVTRRLVVSHSTGVPARRHCHSFWLPLADITYRVDGDQVTISWSDCNQMRSKTIGNYGEQYDWMYDPLHPNNTLTLTFADRIDASKLISRLRFPIEDGVIVRSGVDVEISPSQEARIYDVGRKIAASRILDYRIAIITTHTPSGFDTSKLYIRYKDLDLDLRGCDAEGDPRAPSRDYQMSLTIANIATPTYHSDVRGEPAVDHDKVGRFKQALQLKTSLNVAFPLGPMPTLPYPTTGIVAFLSALTGWTLKYFATTRPKESKRWPTPRRKKHGPSDVLLWEKLVNTPSDKRTLAQITFRSHTEGEKLWTTATINQMTSISTSSTADATLTISNKVRGSLLDIGKMTASQPQASAKELKGSRHHHEQRENHSEIGLTFQDSPHRLEFLNVIEELKTATSSQPFALPRRSMASSSSEPFHRINSLAPAGSPSTRSSGASLYQPRSPYT
ncbi:uncharacterized protein BDZ99DRAFT_77748 [Mytilinidion resinicola]|uniref:Protein kinase domain-containing protein n=1 Tax=Mytilinidion resinicola TaxID=574789 RepID=A0A6A6YHB2_9PEZI|nr:uncharacterized protein BDZ99DRAFT_77748 [Mytilinidion resinicola]KAF2807287.1 hypothetical protein BDZ99DRAFT_77748 [Mytilinidion resinicola]